MSTKTGLTIHPSQVKLYRFVVNHWLFLSIVSVTIISGFWFTLYVGKYSDNIKRLELQQLVRLTAAGINEQRIKSFTATSSDLLS